MKSFGSRKLCKCLKSLGLSPAPQKGTSHIKYKISPNKKLPSGIRPFIIVQIGKKSYHSHARSRYISQIKRLGFSKKEITKHL